MVAGGWDAPRRAAHAGLLVMIALLLLASAVAALHSLGAGSAPGRVQPFSLVSAVVFAVLGAVVAPRQPCNAVGWLFLLIGTAAAGAAAASSWSGTAASMAWLAQWTPWLAYGLLPLPLLLFPDGRLPSPRWRSMLLASVVGMLVAAAALAVAAWDEPTTLLTEVDTPLTALAKAALVVAAAGVLANAVGAVGAVAALWVRWRSEVGETRQQVKWLGVGAAVSVAALLLDAAGAPHVWLIAALAVPVAAAVAILQHRLYDVDLFLRRSVVYVMLTVFVILAYSLFVLLLAALFDGWEGRSRSLVATVAVAAAFHPVQVRLQRAADHLLFGDRSDPYAAVSRLSRNLEDRPASTGDPAPLLHGIAEAIADALRLPYVALLVGEGPEPQAVAEYGRRTGDVVITPMTYQSSEVGQLLVSPRRRGEGLTAGERRLLHDLARQAGLAAHAVTLSAEVQRARERLVRAREEERRRLRRDLHDGLGAALAGLRMQVSTVPFLLEAGDLYAVRQLFQRLEDELGRYTIEVRRLIEGLTPAGLEQLGLPGAVRRAAQAFEHGAHAVRVEVTSSGVPERPGQLPAAVEIAAYHICVEAVTNAARHASATECRVLLTMSERELTVEVVDNGCGLAASNYSTESAEALARGVGLESMRERATELGGAFFVEQQRVGGVRVLARLPLALT